MKQCTKLVYTEFFTQGDLEKAMGNKPVESMDREKAFIPSLQIQFIDHIVLPVYKLLKVAHNSCFTKCIYAYINNCNLRMWTPGVATPTLPWRGTSATG